MLSLSDCGIMLEPQLGMSAGTVVETARSAEEMGFGYFARSDHLLPTNDARGIDSPECWTSLGAVAAATSRIKFGPLVSPVGFRNPALLARMACTLHSFSGGRLQLSVGAGWYGEEFRAHGYPFPSVSERVGQFREAFEIVEALVRKGRSDFDGKYFSAHTDCFPRPAGEFRIVIGTKTKSMIRMAALRADEWNFLSSPLDVYLPLKKVFDSAKGERKVVVSEMTGYLVGRTPSELEKHAALQVSKLQLGVSPADRIKQLRARNAPCGTVEEFVEQLRSATDNGIQKFYFQTLVPEDHEMTQLLADTLKVGV